MYKMQLDRKAGGGGRSRGCRCGICRIQGASTTDWLRIDASINSEARNHGPDGGVAVHEISEYVSVALVLRMYDCRGEHTTG